MLTSLMMNSKLTMFSLLYICKLFDVFDYDMQE